MFTSILSAVEIADIIVFVVLGLALVIGLIGGLAKAFKGLFATISIVLISLLLVGVSVAPISGTVVGTGLKGALEGPIAGWGTAFDSTVYIAEVNGQPVKDGDDFVYCIIVDGENVQLDSVDSEGLLGSLKAKVAVSLAKHFVTEENSGKVTLAGFAADALTSLILDIGLFIVYCIVLSLLYFVIRKLAGRMHKAENTALRVTDRLLGGVVAAALALISLLIVFAIIRAAVADGSKVAQFFENAKVAGVLYDKNPLFDIVAKMFG